MSTKALLDSNPAPTRVEVSKAIAGNLCRCTGYRQIVASIEAATQISKEKA
jgi:carbon-monoxide dehydrogenase small subunit